MVIKSSPILEQEASELLDETEVDSNVSSGSCHVKHDTVGVSSPIPQATQCHMLSGDIDHDSKLSRFIDSVENGKKLSDEHWLNILGITEAQLKHVLSPVAEHILNLFSYLNTGKVLQNSEAHHFGGVLPYELVETLKAGEQPDTLTLLKLLVVIIENFQLNKFFLL